MEQDKERMIIEQIKKAEEKLGAAKALLDDEYYDDSVSRAYYSAFHAASAALLAENITVESHSALKTMFGLHFIKTGILDRKIGRYLNELKDTRENGDYDIFSGFQKEDADKAVNEAEALLAEVKRFLSQKKQIKF